MFRLTQFLLVLALLALTHIPTAVAADDEESTHPLAGMPLREIGPALTSGRISDFAFHPERRNEFYVAVASGGLWKTVNNAITWKPVFDNEGA